MSVLFGHSHQTLVIFHRKKATHPEANHYVHELFSRSILLVHPISEEFYLDWQKREGFPKMIQNGQRRLSDRTQEVFECSDIQC
jgi:hypothetical protein